MASGPMLGSDALSSVHAALSHATVAAREAEKHRAA